MFCAGTILAQNWFNVDIGAVVIVVWWVGEHQPTNTGTVSPGTCVIMRKRNKTNK